jgi:hypothetical protein
MGLACKLFAPVFARIARSSVCAIALLSQSEYELAHSSNEEYFSK